MSLDERVRSTLESAADRVQGHPAGIEVIMRRGLRRRHSRRAGWVVAAAVLVVGFVVLAIPLAPRVDLASARTPVEILADRVVTPEEWEAAGAAVIQCLTDQGMDAEFDADKGAFTVYGADPDTRLDECYGAYMGESVQKVWSDQQADPVAEFELYRSVVECTESRTGVDYGDMTQDSLGFVSTEAHRTINRAFNEAPEVYNSCFDDLTLDADSSMGTIVEEVVSDSQGDARYSVGLGPNQELCAQAGYGFHSQSACGGADIEAVVFQGDGVVALAGYAPSPVAGLTLVFNGDLRRPLQLIPIPGREMYAFGAIETVEVDYVEIEVVDGNGDIIQRFFPSIGSANN